MIPMIVGIHHAQITIPKGHEDKARAFYCDLLGLKEIPKPISLQGRGGFWLQVGEQQVHVGTEDGTDRNHTKAHIAYAVSDLAYWRKNLSDRRIDLIAGEQIPDHARFEFRDPFGNRVELIQKL